MAYSDLGDVTLRSTSVGPMDNISYLVTGRAGGAQVLIDAAADVDALLAMVAAGAGDAVGPATLRLVVTTHRHPDHLGALAELVRRTGARTTCGAVDAAAIAAASGVEPDFTLAHGDVGDFGDFTLRAIELRGHTPGGIALALANAGQTHLLVGDSLFPGGVGRTTSPRDFSQLMDDVEQRLFAVYPDGAVVHPGHGLPTTLGTERPHLGDWRARGW